MPNILFISTKDETRAPMAAAILRVMVPDEWAWRVESAGMWAKGGEPIDPTLQRVMRYRNRSVDLSGHRSRIMTPELLDAADLILVMEQRQREMLIWGKYLVPASRVYRFGEMFGVEDDVTCRDHPYVDQVHAMIDNLLAFLRRGLPRIYELACHTPMPPEARAQLAAHQQQAGKLWNS